MITSFIILYLIRSGVIKTSYHSILYRIVGSAGKKLAAFFICFFVISLAFAQEKKLEYNIIRKGNIVGNISFTQHSTGNRTSMKLESEVKTKFIFTVTANAKEEAIYDNGIMTWSSFYRKMNGNEKANKKTQLTGNSYRISDGSKSETLNNYPIRYNMLSIYSMEPINISKVYSDNFEQFLDIKKINTQHYKIKFPDGNYSEYFYTAGVCAKVEVHHSLYSATIELKK